jgi:hypothetical protein
MSGRARVIRNSDGIALVQGDVTLSRVIDHPGPTHGLFDVLAATVELLAPGPRFLMLGFAAGGVVAPLRGLGWTGAIEAVDRSRIGLGLFRRHCAPWAGDVEVHRDDALAFLSRSRRRWDLILDDLSAVTDGIVCKPAISTGELPARIASRLAEPGIYVANVLPDDDLPWHAMASKMRRPFPRCLLLDNERYENRILVAGAALPGARALSLALRGSLERLGSKLASEMSVRTLS